MLRSKSEELCELIRAELDRGAYVIGARLPSEAELGRIHGVSRTTVRAALAQLVDEGRISGSQGARPTVLAPARPKGAAAVGGIVAVLGRGRMSNPVFQRLLETIAGQLPPERALRVHYTDVPAGERYGIRDDDLVLIDDGFVRAGFPGLAPAERTVVLNLQVPSSGFIGTDNRAGGKLLGQHLIAMGHRTVGILHYGIQEQDFARRLMACRAALREGGAVVEEVQLNLHSHTEFTTKQALELLFRRRPGITAVSCFTDKLAIEVFEILAEFGKRIPADVSVAGYDGLSIATWTDPPLTTVRHAFEDMARLLVRCLTEGTAPPRSLVRPVLIPGGSVGPPSRKVRV